MSSLTDALRSTLQPLIDELVKTFGKEGAQVIEALAHEHIKDSTAKVLPQNYAPYQFSIKFDPRCQWYDVGMQSIHHPGVWDSKINMDHQAMQSPKLLAMYLKEYVKILEVKE